MSDPYTTGVTAAIELGQRLERERIIALLGQNIMQGEGTQWMQFAIALIKGEQS